MAIPYTNYGSTTSKKTWTSKNNSPRRTWQQQRDYATAVAEDYARRNETGDGGPLTLQDIANWLEQEGLLPGSGGGGYQLAYGDTQAGFNEMMQFKNRELQASIAATKQRLEEIKIQERAADGRLNKQLAHEKAQLEKQLAFSNKQLQAQISQFRQEHALARKQQQAEEALMGVQAFNRDPWRQARFELQNAGSQTQSFGGGTQNMQGAAVVGEAGPEVVTGSGNLSVTPVSDAGAAQAVQAGATPMATGGDMEINTQRQETASAAQTAKDEGAATGSGPDLSAFQEGGLYREEGDNTVWVFHNGEFIHLTNPQIFNDLGFSWKAIKQVEPGAVRQSGASTKIGPDAIAMYNDLKESFGSVKEGKLYRKEGDPKVYVVIDGQAVWIPDPNTLKQLGYSFADVQVVGGTHPVFNGETPLVSDRAAAHPLLQANYAAKQAAEKKIGEDIQTTEKALGLGAGTIGYDKEKGVTGLPSAEQAAAAFQQAGLPVQDVITSAYGSGEGGGMLAEEFIRRVQDVTPRGALTF